MKVQIMNKSQHTNQGQTHPADQLTKSNHKPERKMKERSPSRTALPIALPLRNTRAPSFAEPKSSSSRATRVLSSAEPKSSLEPAEKSWDLQHPRQTTFIKPDYAHHLEGLRATLLRKSKTAYVLGTDHSQSPGRSPRISNHHPDDASFKTSAIASRGSAVS